MKILTIILIVGALGFGAWKMLETKPDASVPQATVTDTVSQTDIPTRIVTGEGETGLVIDNQNVKVSFKGFGPGKEHNGSFSDIQSNLSVDIEEGLNGTITVSMNSLSTDTEKVTAHLKTADFFDTAKYPTATFKITKIEGEDVQGGTITGVFTIHGSSKTVSFPFKRSEAFTANFTINMKEFGIDQAFANETVQLMVSIPFK